jgi:NADPH:quinone reductase-like Zn-dependent oxidoreductase
MLSRFFTKSNTGWLILGKHMNEIIYKNGGTATSSFGNRLAGKVAVITGASSGIGEATARELARLGACVVLAARRFDRLQAISDEIASTGGAHSLSRRTPPSRPI